MTTPTFLYGSEACMSRNKENNRIEAAELRRKIESETKVSITNILHKNKLDKTKIKWSRSR
jgi:hypothetical protein